MTGTDRRLVGQDDEASYYTDGVTRMIQRDKIDKPDIDGIDLRGFRVLLKVPKGSERDQTFVVTDQDGYVVWEDRSWMSLDFVFLAYRMKRRDECDILNMARRAAGRDDD